MFDSKDKPVSDIASVKAHLEFLGYAESDGRDSSDILLMEHSIKPNLFIDEIAGGVRVRAAYSLHVSAERNSVDFYKALNATNTASAAVSFSADGKLLTVAYWLATYTKSSFGNFLAAFDHDLAVVGRTGLNTFVQ